MDWREKIEQIKPTTLIEKPDIAVYQANFGVFNQAGFGRNVFAKILPITEQQIWSSFQLFKLARSTGNGARLAEIGSGRGGSIVTMGLANPQASLVNIDKFCPFDEESCHGMFRGYQGFSYLDFQRNIKPFNLNLSTILKWSTDAVADVPDRSLDLLFIDGNHTYENCKEDILNYRNKVKKGGILCGHDYHPLFNGVIKAVNEIYSRDQFYVADNSSIWVVK